MDLKERASYVKGLVDGLDPDFSTKEGRILKELLQLLDDVCVAVHDLNEDIDQIYDEIDAIDQDLTEIEDSMTCDCDDDCHDGGIYEITCPECKKVVCMDEEMLGNDDLACPNCGTSFEIDFSDDDVE